MINKMDVGIGTLRTNAKTKPKPINSILGNIGNLPGRGKAVATLAGMSLKNINKKAPPPDLAKENEGMLASLGMDTFLRPLKKKVLGE